MEKLTERALMAIMGNVCFMKPSMRSDSNISLKQPKFPPKEDIFFTIYSIKINTRCSIMFAEKL